MDNKNKPKEKYNELKKYDQNLLANSFLNNDFKESPTKGFKLDLKPAYDSHTQTIANEDQNIFNEKKRMDLEKTREPTILKELQFNRNINAKLIESVCSDNMDCQYLDTQESKKSNENNDLPISNESQMAVNKCQDVIQEPNITDKEKFSITVVDPSENNNPKSKDIIDSKKAKIMNCKSLDRPQAINNDLKKESSIHKLKDYFTYSNSLKGYNFNEQRKSLKKNV